MQTLIGGDIGGSSVSSKGVDEIIQDAVKDSEESESHQSSSNTERCQGNCFVGSLAR